MRTVSEIEAEIETYKSRAQVARTDLYQPRLLETRLQTLYEQRSAIDDKIAACEYRLAHAAEIYADAQARLDALQAEKAQARAIAESAKSAKLEAQFAKLKEQAEALGIDIRELL